jgi:hypothetical protein
MVRLARNRLWGPQISLRFKDKVVANANLLSRKFYVRWISGMSGIIGILRMRNQ